MNVQELTTFLRPHCQKDPNQAPRYARGKVGTTKRSAPAWKFQKYPLTGSEPLQAAYEIMDRFESERGKVPLKAWVEIMESGDTNPVQCSPPILLEALEADGEAEDPVSETIRSNPAAMVGHAMHGLLGMAQHTRETFSTMLQDKQAELNHAYQRIDSLEGKLIDSMNGRLDDLRNGHAIEGGQPSMMSSAVGGFGARLAELAGPHLEAAFAAAAAAAAAGAAPSSSSSASSDPSSSSSSSAEPGPPMSPEAEIDALLDSMAFTLSSNQAAITEAHYHKIAMAWKQLQMLANIRGWTVIT